jgi:predicted ATPase
MSYTLTDYIAALPIPKELEGLVVNSDNEQIDVLSSLSRINIFVGANNSGKSYILRELMKSEIGFNYLSQELCDELNRKYVEPAHNEFETQFKNYCAKIDAEEMSESSRKVYENMNQNIASLAQEAFAPFVTTHNSHLKSTDIDNLIQCIPIPMGTAIPLASGEAQEMVEGLKQFRSDYQKFIGGNIVKRPIKIYIPEQRTLFNSSGNTLFSGIKEKLFPGAKFSIKERVDAKATFIYDGSTVYDDVLRFRNSIVEASNSFEAYEQFLSEYFFEHKRIKIVASQYNNNGEAAIKELRIKIGNEPEFPIYQLGTGLQMVILLTLPLFECKSGIICIEEPELFLHPGLQKQLLDVFASDDENLPFRDSVFFLSTHSNHIIDSQFSENKRSIFTVQKILNDGRNVKFRITNLAHRQKDALHLLGVTNTSVYLANCTIWVEGVTDRLYLSAFMRAFLGYIKKCQEENTKPELVEEFKNCLESV